MASGYSKRGRSESMLTASQADAPVSKLATEVSRSDTLEEGEEPCSPRLQLELNSCSLDDLKARLSFGDDLSNRILDYRPYTNKDEVVQALHKHDGSVITDDMEDLLRASCRVRPSKLATVGRVLQCWENTRLHISSGPENIKRAWFGNPEFRWQEGHRRGFICTEIVIKRACAGNGVVASCACLGKDPAPGVYKQLCVELLEACPATGEVGCCRVYKTPIEVPSWPRWLAFVRHAQAQHNVDNSYSDQPDTVLTAVGVSQALQAREDAAGDAMKNANAIIVSPMTRAMQTTGLLLGANAGMVPVSVNAACTERWSARCDEGSLKSELLGREAEGLPEDLCMWGGWDELSERWWSTPEEDQWERVEAFYKLAKERPEDCIVFVGHGGFWNSVIGYYLDNCEVVYCDRSFS